MRDLPRPIPPHDAHTHTVFSDGHASVREMALAAEAVGLDSIAITDLAGPDAGGIDAHVDEVEHVARESEVAVLAGVELPILDASGRLALPGGDFGRLRLVLAGLGEETEGIATDVPADRSRLVDRVFAAYTAAVESGHVNVLARPFNLGRFPAPLTPDELPRAWVRDLGRLMAERDVMFELAADAWWWQPDLPAVDFMLQWVPVLQVFARHDVRFVAGTGAREAAAVGNNHFTRRIMRLAGIELSQLVNLRGIARRRRP